MRDHATLVIGLGILAAGILFVCVIAFGLLDDVPRDVTAVPTPIPAPRVTPTPSPVKLPYSLPTGRP